MQRRIRKFFRLLSKRRNSLPEIVWLAVTNRCNLSCGMCQRHYSNLIVDDMHPDVFQRVLLTVPKARAFIMGGCGEPLLHAGFFNMISDLRAVFPTSSITFTTNGTLLTETAINNILCSGINHVGISIEGVDPVVHPRDSRVIKNIQELITRRMDNRLPLVLIQAVLTKNNFPEIFNLVREAKGWGVDFIRILRLQAWKQDLKELRPDLRQERYILRKIRRFAKGMRLKIESSNEFNLLKRLTSHFDRFCVWTDDFIFVDVNGDVYPCCMLTGRKDMVMGNLVYEDLGVIWNGRRFIDFFSNQLEHCRFCDALKYKQSY